MESLYLLIPLSVVLVLIIGAVLVWAVMSGQFEELDRAGDRALREQADPPPTHDGPSADPSFDSTANDPTDRTR